MNQPVGGDIQPAGHELAVKADREGATGARTNGPVKGAGNPDSLRLIMDQLIRFKISNWSAVRWT